MDDSIKKNIAPPEQHYNSFRELEEDFRKYADTRKFPFENDKNNPFKPPVNKFEIVRRNNDSYILLPTSEDYTFLFRGQNNYFGKCSPTLFRKELSDEEIFVERLKCVEFELMLSDMPAVRYFRNNNYYIDFLGLAQHYGLCTDALDLTVDLDVALFFATCIYDRNNDCYHPQKEDKKYVGYIYAYFILLQQLGNLETLFSEKLKAIGLQPFKRPGVQKGFSLQQDKDQDLNAYIYSFFYTKEDSEYFYNKYNQGKALWVHDEIADKTKLIRDAKIYSFDALQLTAKRWRTKGKNSFYYQSHLKKIDYKGLSIKELPWSMKDEELKKINKDWLLHGKKELESTLVQRKVFTEGVGFSEMQDMETFIAPLLLRAAFGGIPTTGDFDSGITHFKKKNEEGFIVNLNRERKPPYP